MNNLQLFLPCGAGIEPLLLAEVQRIALANQSSMVAQAQRGGVLVRDAAMRDAYVLNLHSRLASRVLIQLSHTPYFSEQDLYRATADVAWEIWFTPKHTFKIEITAQASPVKSLNFAALTIKDALCDRFRAKAQGVRPSVETHHPQVRVHAHLTRDRLTLYIDTSGEPLFKRGWREDKGDAPLKETLAAAMLEASGWADAARAYTSGAAKEVPALYDPCCGSGTIAIEAAQILGGVPAGGLRRFGFERLLPYQNHVWDAIKNAALEAMDTLGNRLKTSENGVTHVFASDVSFRMVDFAQRNAERAGVEGLVDFRGGDVLQRMPPAKTSPHCPAVVLVNPPYGERIESGGVEGGEAAAGGFFAELATHWKHHFDGWTAWVLSPDPRLPGTMRLKETRRVVLFNGPIECRLYRFDVRGLPKKADQAA